MMVPVGRLTLVRTFVKSDLLRAMSFVSIPALIAPMLGPIAGGLIVGYLHWRFIFFLNIPIGLAGLVLFICICRIIARSIRILWMLSGLILFGSGIALLSYVLEVFGEHALSAREITGLLVLSLALLAGYWVHAKSLDVSSAAAQSVSHPHFFARPSAAVSSRAWESAGCLFCCRFFIRLVLALLLFNRVC